MIRTIRMLFVVLSLFAFVRTANAWTIAATDSGWYSSYPSTFSTFPNNTNYSTGFTGVFDAFPGLALHNFFVFDLTGLGPLSSATLRAYLSSGNEPTVPGYENGPGYQSSDPTETWGLFDVTTNLSVLMAGTGGINAFNDLGGGVAFGQTIVSADDMGTFIEVSLNTDALASIGAADGLWALGGALLTPNGGDFESIFAYSHDDLPVPRVELVVTPDIPAPATTYLLALALAALCWMRRAVL